MNYYQSLLLCYVALSCVMFLAFCFVFFSYLCTLHLYVRVDFLTGDVVAPSATKFQKEFNQPQLF